MALLECKCMASARLLYLGARHQFQSDAPLDLLGWRCIKSLSPLRDLALFPGCFFPLIDGHELFQDRKRIMNGRLRDERVCGSGIGRVRWR